MAFLELHLPGMDIWGCELQVQIFGQRWPYNGDRGRTSPGAPFGVVLSVIYDYNFWGTDHTEIWTLEVNVYGNAGLTHVYLPRYNRIHRTGVMDLPYADP